MKKNKAIVFEEIRNWHKWIIRYYFWRGYALYFLRFSPQQNGIKRWVREFSRRGIINKLGISCFINEIYEDSFYDKSFDNIDLFFKECNKGFIGSMLKIYNTDEIILSFKNKLNREIARFYFLNTITTTVAGTLSERDIYFIPTDGIYWNRTSREEAFLYDYYRKTAFKVNAQVDDNCVSIVWWAKASGCVRYFLRRLSIYVKSVIFIPLAILLSLAGSLKRNKTKAFKYGLMLTYPPKDFAENARRLDFLLDGKNIRKDDVVFIRKRNLTKRYRVYLKQNKFNFIYLFFDAVKWSQVKKIIHPGLTNFFRFGRGHTNTILDIYLNLLYSFLKWSSFVNQYKIGNFITHGDYGAEAIARNALLKTQTNTSIWFYIDAVNNDNFYKSFDQPTSDRMGFYGFLNYDYLISWSKCISDYFIGHHHRIKNNYIVGPLWSEHIREYQDGLRQSYKIRQVADEKRKKGYKIIGVFDSGYHDERRNTYSEGIRFAEGIKRLLDENKDYFIIFKEKKPRSRIAEYSIELLNLYAELEKHPRAYFPLSMTGPSEVSAFSDIVISFPFTSSTIEAISAKKKALYFDPTGQFKGSYYDRFPGFVCHSYEELNTRINELLSFDLPSFEAYLNEYIRPHITPYLDGNGITRFRELLCGVNR